MPNSKNDDSIFVQEIKHRAIKSVKWSSLAEIVSRLIMPLTTLILARILNPADFGIIGIAMIVISLAQIFQDLGLSKALIQKENEIEKSANVAFWSNVILGTFLYLALFVSAPLIANFFHEPKIVNILKVVTLQIIFFSFGSVHTALLQRKLQFRQLFFVRLGPSIVPAIVSIPMAVIGYGVWSLVWGSLAGAFAQLMLLWRMSEWRPNLIFDVILAKKLVRFGSWVTVEAFLGWLIIWLDSIVLGHFLGVKELGIYRVGMTVILLIFGVLFNPLSPVIYASFSRLQSNPSEMKKLFLRITQIFIAASLPLGIGLVLTARAISVVVFGAKWQGIEVVIQILSVMFSVGAFFIAAPELYRAIGRPDISSKLTMVAILFYLPAYILAAPYGLKVFCLIRFAVAMVGPILHLFVINRVLNIQALYFWKFLKYPAISVLVMAIVVYGITVGIFQNSQNWLMLSSIVICGVISYGLALCILEANLVKKFVSLVRQAVL